VLSDDDIRILFDTAVGSMDFSSGFLDNEEVEVLRKVAVYLGRDPKEATPSNFLETYYPRPSRPSGTPPPHNEPIAPQDVAASRGHIGVAYEMVDPVARIERYTCACGWSGRFVEFDAHLLAIADAL
jgi:hypothetical protein